MRVNWATDHLISKVATIDVHADVDSYHIERWPWWQMEFLEKRYLKDFVKKHFKFDSEDDDEEKKDEDKDADDPTTEEVDEKTLPSLLILLPSGPSARSTSMVMSCLTPTMPVLLIHWFIVQCEYISDFGSSRT